MQKKKIRPVNKLSVAIAECIGFFESDILFLKFIYPEKIQQIFHMHLLQVELFLPVFP